MAAVKPIPDGYSSITPYLIVDGAAKAIDFYRHAFGAIERYRLGGRDGRVGHAELSIGGSAVGIHLYLEDVDAAIDRAVGDGAKLISPVENKFYGDRMGTIEDPFGHKWYVTTHIEDVPHDEIARRAAALHGA